MVPGGPNRLDDTFNATPAVVRSAVLYVLRLLVSEPLPLNEGLLEPAPGNKRRVIKVPEAGGRWVRSEAGLLFVPVEILVDNSFDLPSRIPSKWQIPGCSHSGTNVIFGGSWLPATSDRAVLKSAWVS